MKLTPALRALLALLCFCAAAQPASCAQRIPARPNILFIMADDQAPWAIRCSGDPHAYTPNMDRLAKGGARFTNAFTPTPVCSPSRAALMTSRYGSELGITDWIHPQNDKGLGLDARFPTWPALLSDAGYQTGLIGKWHLGDLPDQHPTRRGYQSFMGFLGGGTPPKNPVLEKDGVTEKREGFIVDLVAEEALEWLQKRDASRPFALSVHFREPHAAYLPVREEDWERVKDLEIRPPQPVFPGTDEAKVKKLMREYLASVAAIDRNLGRILDLLDELRLTENTLVVYTSDHGYNMGHHGIWHKGNGHWILLPEALPPATANIPKGQRPNMFDTSLKVPMLVRWPGHVPAGAENPHVISHLDWLPTLCEVADAALPKDAVFRGKSIAPLLGNPAEPSRPGDFYAEYSTKHQSRTQMRVYRTAEWKLVRDFLNPGRDELFHLSVDPSEQTNLIDSNDPAAKEAKTLLQKAIDSKMREINDPLLLESGKTN
jgi:choline-sulfatase